jgi:tetratricopeptide (TPR) repeat protein
VKKNRFEKILLSIEPLIEKVAVVGGSESEEHVALIKEKDDLVTLFSSDIEAAMEGMRSLLDKAALKVADLEEFRTHKLESEMDQLNDKLSEISDEVDASPVIRIMDKCRDLLDENEFSKVEMLLEKAGAAFEKLYNDVLITRARKEMVELEETKERLMSASIDVTPLVDPIENAKKYLESGQLTRFHETTEVIREKIGYLEREEMKVEYQRSLMKIVNSLRSIDDEGKDTSAYRMKLDEIKETYLTRDLPKCIEMERDLLKEISKERISTILEIRMKASRETLEEAEGLMIETDGARKKFQEAQELMENEDYETALDLYTQGQVELEDKMTARTFSIVEKEIREKWEEGKKYSIDFGDVEGSIRQAYDLAEDDKFKEAMEHLYSFREMMDVKIDNTKAKTLLDELMDLIKKARASGLKIATFKATHTKAKVLFDAGDVNSAIDLLERQIKNINEHILKRRRLQSNLDELRGRLLGVESKVQKMIDMGLTVAVIRQRMASVNELIDTTDVEQAEKELAEIEESINDSIIAAANKKQEEQKFEEPVEEEKPKVEEKTPSHEESKVQLFSLVSEIRNQMKIKSRKGEETTAIKKDIEVIQNLVIKKEYLEAYQVAKNCLERISG